VTVVRSGVIGVLMYAIPIFCIVLVLPQSKITGLGGFIDAVRETFGVWGGAGNTFFVFEALGFIFTLMTSGAVWMMGSDRIQAVAAYDGAFLGFFGVFNKKLGTPVRVNVLSGVVATIFTIVAITAFNNGEDSAFVVVLTIAISTTLISYLWIFPAAAVLRHKYPDVPRPYRVPFGNAGIWSAAVLITLWVALGSWVSIFPGRIERWTGISYDFKDVWGVSFGRFEALTLGTLGVVLLLAVVGYVLGAPVRRQTADVELTPELDPAGA
jgi:amino acid transporter